MSAKNLISELEFELISAEKLLSLLPAEKLLWQPHPKARTLGELALHLAGIPARYLQYAKEGTTTVEVLTARKTSATIDEIQSAFQASKKKALQILTEDYEKLEGATWNLVKNSSPILSLPIPMFVRLMVLNHFVHHRGELVIYLRALDIRIPSIYGPSADENPFA